MTDAEVPTIKLSEVARQCGVEASLLRRLAEDGVLEGTVRTRGGHVYIREDSIPSWHEIDEKVEAALIRHTMTAQGALERVRVEIEAVGNDLQEVLDDPASELGDDLVGLRSYSGARDQTSLTSALARLERASWAVRTYSDALRRIREVR